MQAAQRGAAAGARSSAAVSVVPAAAAILRWRPRDGSALWMGAPWIMSWRVLVDSACEASVLQAQQLLLRDACRQATYAGAVALVVVAMATATRLTI